MVTQVKKERLFGPDLVRSAAIVFVICEHFFLNGGFYDLPLEGPTMALASWLRMLFMVCTPMFMMLSGWFCIKKQWKKGYLRGLLPIALTWLFASALCLLLRKFHLGEPITLRNAIGGILNFSADPYGWYVEMYLGLFLLIPFLNLLWAAMDDAGQRRLVLVFVAITVLPQAVNFRYQILPRFWTSLYPVAYYYLGAWLKEHPLRCKWVWLLLGWFGFAALAAAIRWLQADGGFFNWTVYIDRSSGFVAAESVCSISLLSRATGKHVPPWLRGLLSAFAKLSLPIYLCSYLGDNLAYPVLCRLLPTLKERLMLFPVVIAAVLIIALVLAIAINAAVSGLMKLLPEREHSIHES